MSRYSRAFKFFLIAIVALVFAGVAIAFAASNTVPVTSYAGEGSGGVSGYTVTDLVYTLNYASPSTIETLTFTLAPATADEIKVSFDDGATWFLCIAGVGATKECDLTGVGGPVNVVDVENLTVTSWYALP